MDRRKLEIVESVEKTDVCTKEHAWFQNVSLTEYPLIQQQLLYPLLWHSNNNNNNLNTTEMAMEDSSKA